MFNKLLLKLFVVILSFIVIIAIVWIVFIIFIFFIFLWHEMHLHSSLILFWAKFLKIYLKKLEVFCNLNCMAKLKHIARTKSYIYKNIYSVRRLPFHSLCILVKSKRASREDAPSFTFDKNAYGYFRSHSSLHKYFYKYNSSCWLNLCFCHIIQIKSKLRNLIFYNIIPQEGER